MKYNKYYKRFLLLLAMFSAVTFANDLRGKSLTRKLESIFK